MKSANIFCSDLLNRDEMKKLLTDTKKGLETIRFSISDNLDELDKNIREAKEDLKYFEEPKLYLHGPYLALNPMCYDKRVRQVTLDRFNECYEAADALGACGIVFHSPMIPQIYYTIGWAERVAEFFMWFLEGKSGITVTMENFLDREIEPFVDAASKVTHPDFGLCIDIGHANCFSNISPLKWIDSAKEYIRHVHIHDNDGSDDKHMALGDGNIPVNECLKMLYSLPQEITMTLENQRMEDFYTSLAFL